MTSPITWSSRPLMTAWLAYAAFVVYGSLVPLEPRPLEWAQAWEAFRRIPYLDLDVQSRADWIANGVLYVPMTALGALALGRGRAGPLSMGAALAIALVVAVAVEFAQQWFPPRTVSQNDLIAEAIGAVVGVAVAPRLGRWLEHWPEVRAGWDAQRLAGWLLPAWSVAYVLYAFFPFDLLLSPAELRAKLASEGWGWGIAFADGRSWTHVLLQAAAETALTVPIGALLARWRGWGPIGAGAAGAALGVALELGQLLIASGTSQGLSVLTRALGAAVGAWAWPRWLARGSAPARQWIERHLPLLLVAWLLVLALASGWGRHDWGGWSRAADTFLSLQWQPFYYHYYTTEAVALTSLASVAMMYLPLAAMAWARRSAPGAAALLAAVIALAVEASKLPLAGARPDPTNVLIASAAVWLVVRFAGEGRRRRRRLPREAAGAASTIAQAVPAAAGTGANGPASAAALETLPLEVVAAGPPHSAGDVHLDTAAPARSGVPAASQPAGALARLRASWPGLAVAAGAVALASTWSGPWLLVAAVVLAAAAVTWWRPAAVLAVVPAALPVFDLAPWTGRVFVDEFDLLFVACVAVAWVRSRPPPGSRAARAPGALVVLAFAAFGLSLAASTLLGIVRAGGLDLNSTSHYYGSLNGLRIAKGALAAWIFVLLYRRLVGEDPARRAWWPAGMAAGLAATVVVVIWERLAFVGDLFDFAAPYRVTGLISAMHKGGAYIECYLAVASAFVAAEVVRARRGAVLAGGTLLLAAAAFAVFVTYSRGGYAAFAWVIAAAVAVGVAPAGGRGRALVAGVVLTAAVTAAALPVLSGSFAQERLQRSAQDLETRMAHWRDALSLRDDGLATTLFGMGVGRFPEKHFWRSQEPRAAGFALQLGEGNVFLRLGPGAPVYIDQIVRPPSGRPLALTINVRSDARAPAITVALCRKWTLTSSECTAATVTGIHAPGLWQTQDATLDPLPAPTSIWEAMAPVKLSVTTPARGPAVDIDNVSLEARGEGQPPRQLLANGSFADGMDRWFFATDLDPPWHIHSLPVALLFDQGWLGVATGALLAVVALAAGARAAWRGSTVALGGWLAFVAFLISGSLNTLIDAPRFLFLALVAAWLCTWREPRGDSGEPGRRIRSRSA